MRDLKNYVFGLVQFQLQPESYRRRTAYNNALAKYGAGPWNFIISNIAGLVRGRTVFV